MSFTQPDYSVDNVQTLQDITKNQSTYVKQLLDKVGKDTQDFLIALITEMESVEDGASGSDRIGMTPLADIGAENSPQTIVEKLVSILKSTTDGKSGADFIGMTSISELTGNTIQTVIESLKKFTDDDIALVISYLTAHKTSGDHDSRYYTETESDAKYETKDNLTNTRKLSPTGNFTGTWKGISDPSLADPGIAGTVMVIKGSGDAKEKVNKEDFDAYKDSALDQIDILSQNLESTNGTVTAHKAEMANQLFLSVRGVRYNG